MLSGFSTDGPGFSCSLFWESCCGCFLTVSFPALRVCKYWQHTTTHSSNTHKNHFLITSVQMTHVVICKLFHILSTAICLMFLSTSVTVLPWCCHAGGPHFIHTHIDVMLREKMSQIQCSFFGWPTGADSSKGRRISGAILELALWWEILSSWSWLEGESFPVIQ